MSKTKSSKAGKPAKSDLLTKAKDAAITKPAQAVKAKSKELAKQVVGKEEKKSKKSKKAKEPTPEPSESDDSVSSESESSASESEEDTKPVANGKANGVKKSVAPPQEDSDSEESDSDSDSAESSEDEAPKANGVNKKVAAGSNKAVKPTDDSDSDDSASESDSGSDAAPNKNVSAAKPASSDEDSDESGDDSSEDEKPAAKSNSKAVDTKKSVKAQADSDSEEDSDDGSDSSDESDEEETAKPAPKSVKRKAEDEDEQLAKKTKTEAVDTSKGANLFVGNLSWNVDEAWLREVFEEYGELSGVRVMTDRDTGRSKGFGYVEFTSAEDAATAHAAKQGFELDGRTLNVDYAAARPDNSQRQETRRKSYGDQASEPSDTLFIGNLSFDVGQETVTEAFQPHGTILGIRLPTDRETGQPKGFGYVTFASVDEATSALEAMNGAYIESRPIRLDYSQPRPQNGDSPARGRGGSRGGPRGGARGGRGGRGGSFGGGFGGRGGRGGRGGSRGGSTNRGGFGDFSGRKTNFD